MLASNLANCAARIIKNIYSHKAKLGLVADEALAGMGPGCMA